MKLLIIIATILTLVYANPINLNAAEFECVANYLRDKKMLDPEFKYYVQADKIDCDSFITEIREKFMNNLFTDAAEMDEETKASLNLVLQKKDCMTEQFSALEYPELLMKVYIYSKSTELSESQKKKLSAYTVKENTRKVNIATGICFPESTFGDMFDDIMEEDDDDEQSLEDKQGDYCLRKYVIDNELIDTTKFTVNLNPHNIKLDFECTELIEVIFKQSEETLMENFKTGSDQSKMQLQCLSNTIRNENALGYSAKVGVLSEVLTTEQKKDFRIEYIEKMKKVYIEMAKCLH